jgi:hypothetical protein
MRLLRRPCTGSRTCSIRSWSSTSVLSGTSDPLLGGSDRRTALLRLRAARSSARRSRWLRSGYRHNGRAYWRRVGSQAFKRWPDLHHARRCDRYRGRDGLASPVLLNCHDLPCLTVAQFGCLREDFGFMRMKRGESGSDWRIDPTPVTVCTRTHCYGRVTIPESCYRRRRTRLEYSPLLVAPALLQSQPAACRP